MRSTARYGTVVVRWREQSKIGRNIVDLKQKEIISGSI